MATAHVTLDAALTAPEPTALPTQSKRKADAAAEKVKKDMAHNLSNFKLDAGEDKDNMYVFGGEDYSALTTGDDVIAANTFISLPQVRSPQAVAERTVPCHPPLTAHRSRRWSCVHYPQRERKRNYDVDEYFRDALRTGETKPSGQPKLVKAPQMQEYQFFDRVRIEQLIKKENELAIQRKDIESSYKDVKAREARERKRLVKTQVQRRVALGVSEEDALREVNKELDAEEKANPPPSAAMAARLERLNMPDDELAEKVRPPPDPAWVCCRVHGGDGACWHDFHPRRRRWWRPGSATGGGATSARSWRRARSTGGRT